MLTHEFRKRLRSEPLFGAFVKLARPEIVEVLGLAGFDFVVADCEHGQISEEQAVHLILAARSVRLPVVVRLAVLERGQINRLLEAGAAGIQLARARCDSARELADVMRYPPAGSRGVSLVQPSAGYGRARMRDYLDASNDSVVVVGQIETADFAHQLAETMKSLDVAFVGPVDLSVDLGHDGDLSSPGMRTAVEQIEQAAAMTGTTLGTYATDIDGARRAVEAGYRYVVVSSDIAMLQSMAAALAEGFPKTRSPKGEADRG